MQGPLDTEGHTLTAEVTALKRDKGEQFLGCSGLVHLPEATTLIDLGLE